MRKEELTFSALDCLFDTLKTHGKSFTPSFWSTVSTQILFPIFNILRSSSTDNTARFKSHEDMSVWLSTTLISALRNMIDLWTVYFEVMQEYLDGLLDILVACICQGKSIRVDEVDERREIVLPRRLADKQKTILLLESVLHVSNNSSSPMSENSLRPNGRASYPPSSSYSQLQLHISCLIRNCMRRLNLIIWMNQMVSRPGR